MQHAGWTLLSWLAVAFAAIACATTPDARIASGSAPSCARLDLDIAKTEEDRRLAIEEGRVAWKAVVPFAVAARYAKSMADANAAEDRLNSLHAESGGQGCSRSS